MATRTAVELLGDAPDQPGLDPPPRSCRRGWCGHRGSSAIGGIPGNRRHARPDLAHRPRIPCQSAHEWWAARVGWRRDRAAWQRWGRRSAGTAGSAAGGARIGHPGPIRLARRGLRLAATLAGAVRCWGRDRLGEGRRVQRPRARRPGRRDLHRVAGTASPSSRRTRRGTRARPTELTRELIAISGPGSRSARSAASRSRRSSEEPLRPLPAGPATVTLEILRSRGSAAAEAEDDPAAYAAAQGRRSRPSNSSRLRLGARRGPARMQPAARRGRRPGRLPGVYSSIVVAYDGAPARGLRCSAPRRSRGRSAAR